MVKGRPAAPGDEHFNPGEPAGFGLAAHPARDAAKTIRGKAHIFGPGEGLIAQFRSPYMIAGRALDAVMYRYPQFRPNARRFSM
jgi:hypothetical protein